MITLTPKVIQSLKRRNAELDKKPTQKISSIASIEQTIFRPAAASANAPTDDGLRVTAAAATAIRRSRD